MSRYLLLSLLLTGCSAPAGNSLPSVDASARTRSVAERYWAEQRAQRPEPAPNYEWLILRQPERTCDGVIYLPSAEQIRIPRSQ
jgi:hypothetical protein